MGTMDMPLDPAVGLKPIPLANYSFSVVASFSSEPFAVRVDSSSVAPIDNVVCCMATLYWQICSMALFRMATFGLPLMGQIAGRMGGSEIYPWVSERMRIGIVF